MENEYGWELRRVKLNFFGNMIDPSWTYRIQFAYERDGQLREVKLEIDDDGAREIASRCRGTPRIANRLLRRVRDFAQVRAGGVITQEGAREALKLLDVDDFGLDDMDTRILRTIIEKFDGGPVGIESLAAAIGEERGTLEDVIEPFLIQQGLLMRTARGRIVTPAAYRHFGLVAPERPGSGALFEGER